MTPSCHSTLRCLSSHFEYIFWSLRLPSCRHGFCKNVSRRSAIVPPESTAHVDPISVLLRQLASGITSHLLSLSFSFFSPRFPSLVPLYHLFESCIILFSYDILHLYRQCRGFACQDAQLWPSFTASDPPSAALCWPAELLACCEWPWKESSSHPPAAGAWLSPFTPQHFPLVLDSVLSFAFFLVLISCFVLASVLLHPFLFLFIDFCLCHATCFLYKKHVTCRIYIYSSYLF